MDMPLVSVVTACYNGEKYLDGYFDSILKQTYDNIELIIVNDGSTDNSLNIMRKYIAEMKNRNIQYRIIDKENGGALSAVAAGVEACSGEYLTWPDVDDYIHKDYLERKINYFLEHPECDILINSYHVFNDDNLETIIDTSWKKEFKSRQELIERFIKGIDVGYAPGAFMARTKLLFELYPDKKIFSDMKIGQNVPMVFPLIYMGNAGYSKECLYDYYLHKGSVHVTGVEGHYRNLKLLYEKVLDTLHVDEKEKKKVMISVCNRSDQLLLGIALEKRDKKMARESIINLKENNGYRLRDHIKYWMICNGLLYKLYTMARR